MESAELKSKKRVRHSYPRREIYHRFVHDNSFVYHNGSYSVWGKDNWLFAGYCYSPKIINSKTKDELYEDWKYRNSSLIAVIDRDKKRILITNKYKEHPWDLQRAVPDNWEVFWTDEDIPSLDIFDKEEKLYKLAIKYLIEKYVEYYLTKFYRLFHVKSHIVHYDLENIYSDSNRYYKEITQFVKKYKLNKYDWSKVSLNEHFKVSYNYKDWWNKDEVAIPSIRNICRNKLFTSKETTYIEQCYFYTKYCYGYNIPFKDVVANWNKINWNRNLAIKYNRSNVCVELLHNPLTTYNDYIQKSTDAIKQYYKNIIANNIAKSEENRRKAIEQLNSCLQSENVLKNWRDGKGYHIGTMSVEYRRYFYPTRRNSMGIWKIDHVSSYNYQFPNTQLRLQPNNHNIIQTSKGACVPIISGIECWKLFVKLKQQFEVRNAGEDAVYRLENRNIKVGIYNLRFIKYCNKYTDNNKPLDKKDWVIVIGCHHLWLEEILDFIKYYHLEKEFGI